MTTDIKPTIIQQAGGVILVKYPHRKTPNLFVAISGHPIFCAECGEEIAEDVDAFLGHIMSHIPRKKFRFIIGGQADFLKVLFAFSGKYFPSVLPYRKSQGRGLVNRHLSPPRQKVGGHLQWFQVRRGQKAVCQGGYSNYLISSLLYSPLALFTKSTRWTQNFLAGGEGWRQ